MSILKISVVIPCFNNGHILPVTLTHLIDQSLSSDCFEVLIVDDGSTDDTPQIIGQLKLPPSFRYFRRQNEGAAAARNFGAFQAQGRFILFLDSDVVSDSSLLETHLDVHRRYPNTLVVGRTRSIPLDHQGIFYRTMGDSVFAFDLGETEHPLPFQDVVSRNFSMPRAVFLELNGFDERYPGSGFEDTEFALRATKAGYGLLYSPAASGEHQHPGSLERVGQHMYNYQISAAMLFSQYPEARGQIPHLRDKEPIIWGEDNPTLIMRKVWRWVLALPPIYWLLRHIVTLIEKVYPSPKLLEVLYWQVLGVYLYRGYKEGRRRYGLDA